VVNKADEDTPIPTEPGEATGDDIRASLVALREDVGRLGDDLARLAQCQRNATRGRVLDFQVELQNRIRENPLSAALILTFFGYVMGRLHRSRRAQ
jgi:hypothetical protein